MKFYIASFLCELLSVCLKTADAAPPPHFVFGDSLLDSGNNNYLESLARADSYPYGIDYPAHQPTGRFSNGLNIADFISRRLGAEPVLPYLDPSLNDNALLRGANFASAGVGILNDTGQQFGQIIRMPYQFQLFQEYQDRVASIIGPNATNRLVAGGLVSISLGGNDYINNYFLYPLTARSVEYSSLPAYTYFIISEFKKYLARFYELGARRVLVVSVGPLGCSPAQRAMRSVNGECVPELQQAAKLFNSGLRSIINQLNNKYSAHIFTVGHTFRRKQDMFTKPQAFRFSNANSACCGEGPYNGLGFCTALSNVCPNRDSYVFWDEYHPSQRAIHIIVRRFFSGSKSDIHPVNLRLLMKMRAKSLVTSHKEKNDRLKIH